MNCRSIKTVNNSSNKLAELQNIVYCNKVDIVVLTKTWLNSQVKNTDILNESFTIYSRDRDPECESTLGGGVVIAPDISTLPGHFTSHHLPLIFSVSKAVKRARQKQSELSIITKRLIYHV